MRGFGRTPTAEGKDGREHHPFGFTMWRAGGVVIGLNTAYHLARKRAGRIVVLEQDALGDGSSSRAAGITSSLMWTETGTRARQLGVE